MNGYTVLIDEAGDLGVNRGTRWFVITGVIVSKEKEPDLRATLKRIKTKLNIQYIHFRKLRDFAQKSYVVNEIAKCDFTYVNIVIDTTKINIVPKTTDGKPAFLTYNYACRLLLERISWFLHERNGQANIILSSRGTARDGELIDYIENKLFNYANNKIYSNAFNKVLSKSASDWDMLQLADICATTMFYQFEPNGFGFISPCFCMKLRKFIYTKDNNLYSYGIKYYSKEMRPDKEYFISRMICRQ